MEYARIGLKNSIKSGALAGLFGAWAIFGFILLVDSTLGLESGTLYKVIAMALGFNTYSVYIGFLLHMLTGTGIGALFGLVINGIRLRIKTSRIIGLGLLAGVVTFGALFMPITYILIVPSLSNIAQILNEPELLTLADSYMFIAGALAMHIIYGFILGLMHYIGIAEVPRTSIKVA